MKKTIREWCCYCGQRLHPEVAVWNADWCSKCSPHEPHDDVNAASELFWSAIAYERKAPLEPSTVDDACKLHPTDLFAAQQRARHALWILDIAHARHIKEGREQMRSFGFRFEGDV